MKFGQTLCFWSHSVFYRQKSAVSVLEHQVEALVL